MYKVRIWKKLVALSMIVILGVSTVVIASLQTRHQSPMLGSAVSGQISNEDIVSNVSDLLEKELNNARRLRTNVEELERALYLQEVFENQFVEEQKTEIDLSTILTEEELQLAGEILSAHFGSEDSSYDESDSMEPSSRWFWGRRISIYLYAYFSPGWLVGGVSTTLLTFKILSIVAQKVVWGTITGGIVGLAVGAIIGATLGVAITILINQLFNRQGRLSLYYTLLHASWSILIFNLNVRSNLFDIIFELIQVAGGNRSSTQPMGAPSRQVGGWGVFAPVA